MITPSVIWKQGHFNFLVEIFSSLLCSSICLVLCVFCLRNIILWLYFVSVVKTFSLNRMSSVLSTKFLLFSHLVDQQVLTQHLICQALCTYLEYKDTKYCFCPKGAHIWVLQSPIQPTKRSGIIPLAQWCT